MNERKRLLDFRKYRIYRYFDSDHDRNQNNGLICRNNGSRLLEILNRRETPAVGGQTDDPTNEKSGIRTSEIGCRGSSRGEVVLSIPIPEGIAGVLGIDLADLIRTGCDRSTISTSTTAAELNHLVGQLTKPRRELALELLKVVARHRRG